MMTGPKWSIIQIEIKSHNRAKMVNEMVLIKIKTKFKVLFQLNPQTAIVEHPLGKRYQNHHQRHATS